jgi:hypothetical protein
MTAVALRAHYQIGLLSKGLETGAGRPTEIPSTAGKNFKGSALKVAGILIASACRDEKLTEIITLDECERLCRERAA